MIKLITIKYYSCIIKIIYIINYQYHIDLEKSLVHEIYGNKMKKKQSKTISNEFK